MGMFQGEPCSGSAMMLLVVVLLLLMPTTLLSQRNGTVGGQKLVCYAELWAGGRPSPANYDMGDAAADNCDYLVLIYLTLDPDTWTLRMNSGYGDVDPEEIRKGSRLRAKNPSLKVLLSVGGLEDGVAKYSDMMSEASRRKVFVDSVVQTLDAYELDGLELHWLYPGDVKRGGRAEDKENFLLLVKELNTAFKPKNWILTASVPPDEATLRGGYNVPRLNSLLHQIHLRTLDMRGHWNEVASGPCPLYSSPWEKLELRHLNVNDSLSTWEREGASSRKLLPTFPFYGGTFMLSDSRKSSPGSAVTGPGQATALLRVPGLVAYFEICDDLLNRRLTRHYQPGSETPFAVGSGGWVGYDDRGLWVGYEDEESLTKKFKLLADRKVGGVAVFALGLDDFAGTCGQSHFLLHKTRKLMDESFPYYPDPSVVSP